MLTMVATASWLFTLVGVPAREEREAERVWRQKTSPAAEARAGKARERIKQEVDHLTGRSFWAGEYYYGDGLGVNVSLHLAPESGFLFEWHGCLGLYDRNYGAVVESVGRLRLAPELANGHGPFEGIAENLVPVRWGERRYLIASDELRSFCNSINAGLEPRDGLHGGFLLRGGDESRPATGRPELLDGPLDCLLARPIEARIVAVGQTTMRKTACDWKCRVTSVTLDVGSADGVWEGMEFHIREPRTTFAQARVIRVQQASSEAEVLRILESEPRPAVGWRLSTRLIHSEQ